MPDVITYRLCSSCLGLEINNGPFILEVNHGGHATKILFIYCIIQIEKKVTPFPALKKMRHKTIRNEFSFSCNRVYCKRKTCCSLHTDRSLVVLIN